MPGVGQTISKLGTFFVYTLALSMPIFEKKSHPIRPVEGLKLSLDFYVIRTLHKISYFFKPTLILFIFATVINYPMNGQNPHPSRPSA